MPGGRVGGWDPRVVMIGPNSCMFTNGHTLCLPIWRATKGRPAVHDCIERTCLV